MSECNWLDGENVAPKNSAEAKALIGKDVIYLKKGDVDSWRGRAFPKDGKIVSVVGKNIAIDQPDNFVIHTSDLLEMVIVSNGIFPEQPERLDWEE